MFPYYELTIVFIAVVYVFETYLSLRQRRNLKDKNKPKQLTFVDDETYSKSQNYSLDKNTFGLVSSAFNTTQSLLILYLGLLLWLWDYSGELLFMWTGMGRDYEVTQSLVFLVISTVITSLLSLPFDLYSTFVLEQKHGFNSSTLSLFFVDLVKSMLLSAVIDLPLIGALLHLIKWGGDHFYLYVWAFMFVVQMVAVIVYPTLIQPCFNKVTPLPEGNLRTAIEALAQRIGFPLKNLYVIDGSKRSSHSNAYFYGFCRHKRIVLFDTLIEQANEAEIVAILGHELGHWKCNHTVKMLVLAQIQLLINMFLFSQFMSNVDLYASFGFSTQPTFIGLMLFGYIYSPTDHVVGFLSNVLSRRFEFQADAFARDLGFAKELREGLIKLGKKNLSSMNPDPWYSAYHYSHPPLVERLRAIEQGSESEHSKKEQ